MNETLELTKQVEMNMPFLALKLAEAFRATAAPDAAKLKSLASTLRNIEVPTLNTPSLTISIGVKINAVAVWIESQCEKETLDET